jgi:hypothetical protein
VSRSLICAAVLNQQEVRRNLMIVVVWTRAKVLELRWMPTVSVEGKSGIRQEPKGGGPILVPISELFYQVGQIRIFLITILAPVMKHAMYEVMRELDEKEEAQRKSKKELN